jgi:hypothetical protein
LIGVVGNPILSQKQINKNYNASKEKESCEEGGEEGCSEEETEIILFTKKHPERSGCFFVP